MVLNQSIAPEYILHPPANQFAPPTNAFGANATENVNLENTATVKIVKACFLATFMLVGIIGNVCICVFIIRARELRTRANAFYICISVANIGVAANCIPFTLSSILTGKWTLGAYMCYLNGIANPFWITATSYSVTASTINKFVSLTRPMKRVITRRKASVMVAAIWFASAAVCIWPMLKRNLIVYKPVAGHCGYSLYERKEEVKYVIFLACAVLICPTVINIYCYVRMFRALDVHRHRMSRSASNDESGVRMHKRNVITLYIVFVVFFITWLPFNIYSIIFIANSDDVAPDWLLAVSYIFAYSTCAQVPVIVIYRSTKLKSEFKRLLQTSFAFLLCKQQSNDREVANRNSDPLETVVDKRASIWFVSMEAGAQENETNAYKNVVYNNHTYEESHL